MRTVVVFSAPFRPQQAENLATLNPKADAIDRDLPLAVDVAKLLDENDVAGHLAMITEGNRFRFGVGTDADSLVTFDE